MRALLDGHFDEADQLADLALRAGEPLQPATARRYHWLQKFWVLREQGRLGEVSPAQWAGFPSSLPAWRLGLAFTYGELGHEAEARRELERLAPEDVAAGLKDINWLLSAAQLSELYARLGERERAAELYDLLLPYESRCLIAGRGAICLGALAQRLGLLCTVLERWDDGEAHFERALERNAALGAQAWLAHTRHQFATLLIARGASSDGARAGRLLREAAATAGELGMKLLLERLRSAERAHSV
jgi:tetratricopeptide (TPR) repeat protein